jgi:hypothetical protein
MQKLEIPPSLVPQPWLIKGSRPIRKLHLLLTLLVVATCTIQPGQPSDSISPTLQTRVTLEGNAQLTLNTLRRSSQGARRHLYNHRRRHLTNAFTPLSSFSSPLRLHDRTKITRWLPLDLSNGLDRGLPPLIIATTINPGRSVGDVSIAQRRSRPRPRRQPPCPPRLFVNLRELPLVVKLDIRD